MDHSPRFWALLERHLPRLPRATALAAPQRRHARARAASRPRVAVVGHVEWLDFAVVDHLPARGRDRPRARALRARRPAAARSPPCRCAGWPARRLLLTALGDDELGAPRARRAARPPRRRPARRRARRAPAPRASPTSTRAPSARSPCSAIASCPHGDDALPWDASPRSTASTSPAATPARVRAARRAARVLVATPRAFDALARGRRRARRRSSPARPTRSEPRRPRARCRRRRASSCARAGAHGGAWEARRRQRAAAGPPSPPPGPPVDAYGCGDSFAAGAHLRPAPDGRCRRARLPPAAARGASPAAGPTARSSPAAERRARAAARRRPSRRLAPRRARLRAAPGLRLGRAVAAHVDAAAQPARPGDLAAQRDLLDRLVLAREHAGASRGARRPSSRALERGQRARRATSKRSRSTAPSRRTVRRVGRHRARSATPRGRRRAAMVPCSTCVSSCVRRCARTGFRAATLLGEHRRREAQDAVAQRRVARARARARCPRPLPCSVVGDRRSPPRPRLGSLASRAPSAPTPAMRRRVVAVHGDDRVVVDEVDLGEVAQLGRVRRGLGARKRRRTSRAEKPPTPAASSGLSPGAIGRITSSVPSVEAEIHASTLRRSARCDRAARASRRRTAR